MTSLAEKYLFAQNGRKSSGDGIQDIWKDTESNFCYHLLAFKAEIIQNQLHFSFRAERHVVNIMHLLYFLICCFVSFSPLARRGNFFV